MSFEQWEWEYGERLKRAQSLLEQLARDVLSLAEDAGMPDTYMKTDQRVLRARAALEEDEG